MVWEIESQVTRQGSTHLVYLFFTQKFISLSELGSKHKISFEKNFPVPRKFENTELIGKTKPCKPCSDRVFTFPYGLSSTRGV